MGVSMQFKEFFNDEILLPSVNHVLLITEGLVTQMTKSELISHTQDYTPPEDGGMQRITRSNNVKVMSFSIKPADEKFGKDYQHLEFVTRANPSVEERPHYGYLIFNNPRQSIKELFCSCNDFFFRAYYPFVKRDLATFNLDPEVKQLLTTKYTNTRPEDMKTHNGEASKWAKTNKGEKLFLCKHLYRAIREYMYNYEPVPMKKVPKSKTPLEIAKKVDGEVKPIEKPTKPTKKLVKKEVEKEVPVKNVEFAKKTKEALSGIKKPVPVKSAVKPATPVVDKEPEEVTPPLSKFAARREAARKAKEEEDNE